MEFLPILKDGKKVYAGFWERLGAAIFDILVWIPFAIIIYYVQSINISLAVVAAIINAFFFSIYSIFFNLKYGGSLGKLTVGIRITKPNGEKIGLKEALLRSSVDIIYGAIFAVMQVKAISSVDPEAYLSAGYIKRMELTVALYPAISSGINKISDIWYWSEMVVLLFNKRKRALHDFIAKTVVIHKEHA